MIRTTVALLSIGLCSCSTQPPSMSTCDKALLSTFCKSMVQSRLDSDAAAKRRQQAFEDWYRSLTPDQRFQYDLQMQRERFDADQSQRNRDVAQAPVICTFSTNGTMYCP